MKILQEKGVYKAVEEPIGSLFCSVSGHNNTGKTTFGLSGPGDVMLFNFDKGLKGVIQRFTSEKDIYILDVDIPKPKTQSVIIQKNDKDISRNIQLVDTGVMEAACASLDKVLNTARKAMLDSSVHTLFFDTGTALWELWRVARFGKILEVPGSAYPPVNAEFVGFCDELKASGKNIIFSHKMRDIYINDKKTGKYEPAQFSTMDHITDVSLITNYDEDNKEFSLYFTRCKPNISLQYDFDIPSTLLHDFPSMAALAVEDSEEEDWR